MVASDGVGAMFSSLILFCRLCFDVWQDGKTPLVVACRYENQHKKGEVEALLRAAGAKEEAGAAAAAAEAPVTVDAHVSRGIVQL